MDDSIRDLFGNYPIDHSVNYTSLTLQSDGTVNETPHRLDSLTVESLFPFLLDKKMHVFCYCFEGLNGETKAKLKELWLKKTEKRRHEHSAQTHIYSTDIPAKCSTIIDLVLSLHKDLEENKLINETLGIFLNKVQAGDNLDNTLENANVAFIYLISSEVYEGLKCNEYNLLRLTSIVIKTPELELTERSNKDRTIVKENETKKSRDELYDKGEIKILDLNLQKGSDNINENLGLNSQIVIDIKNETLKLNLINLLRKSLDLNLQKGSDNINENLGLNSQIVIDIKNETLKLNLINLLRKSLENVNPPIVIHTDTKSKEDMDRNPER